VLGENGGRIPMPDLKEATGLGASAYGTVARLVEAGVARKRTDPDDQRRKLVELTDDGADHVDVDGDLDGDAGKESSDDQDDADSDQKDLDEGQEAVDAGGEIDAATNGGGPLTVTDIDWLDEASFHAALAESSDLEDLRETLGWLDEDGDLRSLVQSMGATDDLPDFQGADINGD